MVICLWQPEASPPVCDYRECHAADWSAPRSVGGGGRVEDPSSRTQLVVRLPVVGLKGRRVGVLPVESLLGGPKATRRISSCVD